MNVIREPYVRKPTALSEMIRKLSPLLDMKEGPWLVGGAVLRDHLEMELDDGDLDILFRSEKQRRRFLRRVARGALMKKPRWYHRLGLIRAPGSRSLSDTSRYMTVECDGNQAEIQINWVHQEGIGYFNRTADFTVCCMVTDGCVVEYTPQADADARSRTLRANPGKKPTRLRVSKYVANGFQPCDEIVIAELDNSMPLY